MSYPAPPPASPPPASSGQSSASSRQSSTASTSSFFNDLFDLRFTRFVSLRLISVVYILILMAVSLVALGAIFTAFAFSGVGLGIFCLILAPLLWVVFVVLARVALEAFAVLFRIHDDTSRTADGLAGGRTAPAAGAASNLDAGYGSAYPGSGFGTNPPPPSTPQANPASNPSSPPWT